MQNSTTQQAPLMSRGRKSWNCILKMFPCNITALTQVSWGKQMQSSLQIPSSPFRKDEEKNICLCSLTSSVLFYDYSWRAGNREVKALQFWGGSTPSKFGLCYLSNEAWKSACLTYKFKTYKKLKETLGKIRAHDYTFSVQGKAEQNSTQDTWILLWG